jgi:hypothetical protein
MNPIQASCKCGSMKVEITGEPVAQFYCHCGDCQDVHGAAYVPIIMFPTPTVTIVAGEPSVFRLKNNPRTSCASCGTRMFAEPPGMGVRGVMAQNLPAGVFKPTFHVQCQHAVLPLRDELPHFKAYPKVFGGSDETVSW